jgi:TolB-like protein/Flp pilus assembly protein TadD
MRRLISEVRRRKVDRAAALYAVGALASVEAADLLAPLLGLPTFVVQLVLALAVAGFPIAMVVAWRFDRQGRTLVRTAAPESSARVQPPDQPAGPPTILVAPFDNASPDVQNEYIADGITDEIIADLGRLSSVRVIARSSAMRLKGQDQAPVETARELGVRFLLEGVARRSGDALRVTANVIDVGSGELQWSDRFDGTLEDLFAMQEQVARAVVDALAIRLSGSEAEALSERGREDPRAIESYLRARHETWRFSAGGLHEAERHLRNGLAVVGDSALLHATLGHVHAWYAQLGLDPDGSHLRAAQTCVDRVFELEPDSGRGHLLQGLVYFQAGRLRDARAPLRRALETQPDDPDANAMSGYLALLSGQHGEALARFEQAIEVDPLTPLNQGMPGAIAAFEGRPAEGVSWYRTFYDMDPDSPFAAWCMTWVLLQAGETNEAATFEQRLRERHADSTFAALATGLLHGVRGDQDAAYATITPALRGAAGTSELFARELAHVTALAGRTDEALDWLATAVRIGNVNHPWWTRHDPFVEELRSDPRFVELMEQVEREWRSLNPDTPQGV